MSEDHSSFADYANQSFPFDLNAECNEVHSINDSYKCIFVTTVEDCVEIIEYLDYNYFIFCHFGFQNVIPAVIICALCLLMLFITLGVTSNCYLCPALFAISKHLGLSQNVAGVTLLAFGNGAPDIFSSAAGLEKASAELAIASLVGAGAFVTTVVAGSVFLTQPFSLMVRPFLRDVTFYVVAVVWTFILFHCSDVYPFHGAGFVALYFVYIVVVLGSRFIYVTRKNREDKPQESPDEKTLKIKGGKHKFPDDPEKSGAILKAYYFSGIGWFGEPELSLPCSQVYSTDNSVFSYSTSSIDQSKNNGAASTEKLQLSDKSQEVIDKGEFRDFLSKVCPINHRKWPNMRWWEKIAALVKSPAILILKITVPVIDTAAEDHLWSRYLNCVHCFSGPFFITVVSEYAFHLVGGVFPVALIVLCLGTGVGILVLCTSQRDKPPVYHWVFAYLGFAVAVTWVYCLANEIVALLQVFGVVFDLSDAVLGLTILAWGNSLSDFLSNLSVARKGFPRMAISACYGGPLLALLLGLGIPLILEVVKGRSPARKPLTFSAKFAFLFCAVAISLTLTTSAMAAWKFNTRRWYGAVLIAIYVAFVALSLLEEFGVFSIVF